MGTIDPSPNPDDFVDGVVPTFPEAHLASLDAVESYGRGYDSIEVDLPSAVKP